MNHKALAPMIVVAAIFGMAAFAPSFVRHQMPNDRSVRQMGDMVELEVDPALRPAPAGGGVQASACADLVAAMKTENWVLFANGQALPNAPVAAFACDAPDAAPRVSARLTIAGGSGEQARTRQDWLGVLGTLNVLNAYEVTLGAGPRDKLAQTKSLPITLELASQGHFSRMAFFAALSALAFLVAMFYGDFARDPAVPDFPGVPRPADYRRPYSLARAQLLWWSGIVIVSYVLIYSATGALNIISAGALVLMGIVGGTSVLSFTDTGSASVDDAARGELAKAYQTALASNDKDLQKRIQDDVYLNSRNFLLDVLTDASGTSAHRLQLLAWTFLLGVFFIFEVLQSLTMPNFDATLLGLTGIANGTYFGFKMQEKHVGP